MYIHHKIIIGISKIQQDELGKNKPWRVFKMGEKTGEIKGKAKEIKGELKGKTKEIKGELKGKAKETEGKLKGKLSDKK